MKRQIAFLLSFIIALGSFAIPVSAEGTSGIYGVDYVKYGDVDYDDNVSAGDALLILQVVVGNTVLDQHKTEVADVDDDSTVGATDALVILRYVVGKIKMFSAGEIYSFHSQEGTTWDELAAKTVDDAIIAIGTVTLDREEAIVAAREAYEALTDAQKEYVTNLSVLEAAETTLATLKAQAEQEAKDKAAAKDVDVAISDIGEVTLEKEPLILSAREVYTALTDAQKAYVTKLDVLEAAETKLATLKAQAEQEAKDKAAAKAVDDAIGNIGTVTLSGESAITAAREAYEALTDAQKEYVTKLEVLEAAETKLAELKAQAEQGAKDKAAAKKVDDAIGDIGTVTLDKEDAITSAREAYEALTDAQKAYVAKLEVLEAAEQTLATLKAQAEQEAKDKAAAKAVDDEIGNIGTVTLDKEDAITSAREAYETLTVAQKAYVTKLDVLVTAEQTLATLKAQAEQEAKDKAAAKAVDDAIGDIGTVTLSSESAITAAREAYETLTDAQKAYVTKLDVLEAAEQTLATLKAQAEQEAKDKAAAKKVDDAIGNIGTVTLDKEDAITAAREAYEALTDTQKAYVAKLDVLVTAEQTLATLKAQAEQEAKDKAAAKAVDDAIGNIGTVTLSSESAITSAREAYEALTDAQKGMVTKLSTLTAAETKLANLKAAKAVDDKIAAIGTVTLSSESAITAAREAYEALTDAQKGMVTKLSTLTAAETKLKDLKAAKAVDDKIAAIGTVTLSSESAITAARSAYTALTSTQQALVTKLSTLTAAETKLANLKAAKAVDDKIAAIGTVTLSSESAITAARSAYTALTSTQQALVTKLSTLTAAETKLANLKAAKAVDDKIAAIGTVTLSSESAIAAARSAYTALTSTQQALVTKLSTLTAAETKLKDLKAAKAVDDKIAAIGTVTLSSESAITAARSAYTALTSTQQTLVTKLSTLTAAETTLANLKAAKAVDDKIAAIGTVTLAKESTITAARSAYNALNATQKGLVTKLSTLTAAETTLANLKAAKAVDDKIDAIGTVTLAKESTITAARSAYNALTSTQRGLVTKLSTLTAAEAKLAELKATNYITSYNKSNSVNGAYVKDTTADTSYSLDVSDLTPNTIYRLNKAVLAPSNHKGHADIERLIYSLQGLINRDFGMDNKHTVLLMVERDNTDTAWHSQLVAQGTIMNGMTEKTISTFDAFLTTFLPTIKKSGIILWDGNVPATSNVAATICGLDGYLPVLNQSPLHTTLTGKGVTIKQTLVGQFVDGKKGTTISGTSVKSTGSAKNDAYLWALEKYFSRCSTQYLAYILDGAPTLVSYSAYPNHPTAVLGNSYRRCIANHDYLIARRCFFFDLAPYAGEAACDDPAQKNGQAAIGTDNATMLKIFQARYDRANGAYGFLMGFPPWWVKYTASDNMGSKDPTWIEWLFCEYITCYNMSKEADAAGTVDMTNGSMYYKFVPSTSKYTNTTSPCESVSYDKNTFYYTIYMGDYDSSAWLKSAAYSMWLNGGGDKKRGTLPLMWSINPNLSERIPMVFDYMFKNKTSKDYFVGGDGGAGYIIPEALFHDNVLAYMGERRPYANGTSGGVFANFSKKYYQRFGMEMTGFIINGAQHTVSANIADCVSRYSPKLNFTNCHETPLGRYGSTYFVYCHNGVETGQSNVMYEHAVGTMNKGLNFSAYRTVVLSPTKINTIVTDFSTYASAKGMKVKYVDPYTYYNLVKASGQGTNLGTATSPSTSSTPQAASPRPSTVVLDFDTVEGYTGKFNTSIAIETNEKKEGHGSMRLGYNAPTAQSGSTQIGGMVVQQYASPINLSSANTFTLDYWVPQSIVGAAALQVNFVTNGTDDGYNFLLDISYAQPGWHTLRFGKNGVSATANNPNWASISAIRITYFNYSNNANPNFMLLDNLTADASVTIPDPAVKTGLLSFDSVNNFTGAFNTGLAIETNEKKEGSGSMRLGFNAPTAQSGSSQIGGMVYYTFPSAVNLSDAKKFTLDFYTPQTFNGSAGLQINFVTNGSDDGYNYLVGIDNAKPGWNTITIDKNSPSATANSPNWSSIKGIRITYFNYCNSATPVFILLDNLVKVS